MDNVSIVGIDLAKQSFQLNGALPDGSGVFCKRLSRPQLLAFLEDIPDCSIAMEAALHPIIGGVRLASLALRRGLSHLFTSPRL